MKKITFWLTALAVLLLTACSSSLQVKSLPEQSQPLRTFKVEQLKPQPQLSLLAVQFEPNQWRWVQTDPLGSPLARVIFDQQGWRNDGFIMPNKQAEQLFSALTVALNPTTPPFQLERKITKDGEQDYQQGKFLWRIKNVAKNPPQFEVSLADQSLWRISELEQ